MLRAVGLHMQAQWGSEALPPRPPKYRNLLKEPDTSATGSITKAERKQRNKAKKKALESKRRNRKG